MMTLEVRIFLSIFGDKGNNVDEYRGKVSYTDDSDALWLVDSVVKGNKFSDGYL